MTNKEAVNWLINLTADIGKSENRNLWHYEQALIEIKEMLESSYSEIQNSSDCIDRAEAQTAIQFAARRYTVAHEAHGEGHVVWSDNLISVTDAMNALREVPSAQPFLVKESGDLVNDLVKDDTISRQAALKTIGLIKSKRDKISVFSDDFDIISRTETMIAISNLLPAQPEREKGKWIPVTKIYKVTEDQFPKTHIEWVDATEPDEIDAVRCSECGEVFDFQDARNWCTECGTDMR